MAPLNRTLSRLKSVDFYKKIPRCGEGGPAARIASVSACRPASLPPALCHRSDLTEATLTGAWLSIGAAVVMVLLLFAVGGAVPVGRARGRGWQSCPAGARRTG